MKRKKSTKNAFVLAFISLFLGLSCFVLGALRCFSDSDSSFVVVSGNEISATDDSGIGIDVKWTSENGGYFYFEEGIYPQTFVGWSLCEDYSARLNNGTITPAYYLSIAGQSCPVCLIDGDYYMQYHNTKPVTVKLNGSAEGIYFGNARFWFKLNPIRWRVSAYGVAEDDCTAIPNATDGVSTWVDRLNAVEQYVVSELVLHYGSSGMMNLGEGTNETALQTEISGNWNIIKSDLAVHEANVNLKFDKVGDGTTNVKVISETKLANGMYQASLEEIDTLYKTDASKFNEHRKAKASDLVCILMGVDDRAYCDYSTRTLFNNQNCRKVNAFGTDKNVWLDTDYGMRLTYCASFEKNAAVLYSGADLTKNIKNTSSYSTTDKTVSSIVFDYYRDSNGNKTTDTTYYVDGTDMISGLTGVAVDAGRTGLIMVYGGGTSDVYVLSAQKIYGANDMSYAFYNCYAVSSIIFNNFDTSNVTNMFYMFNMCGYDATNFSLDLSSFDTSRVTNMASLFNNCGRSATSFSLDLSSFDTSSVTNMNSVFQACGRSATNFSLDLSGWQTTNVTNMEYMFRACGYTATSFRLNLSGWQNTKVTTMNRMFLECGYSATDFSLELNGFKTPSVTSMYAMFESCGRSATNFSLDLSSFETSRVTTMTQMFSGCGRSATNLSLNLTNFDTSKVMSMQSMFSGYGYSVTNFSLNLTNFDTSSVTNMASMFANCGYNATSFSLGLSSFDTSSVTTMQSMFASCGRSVTSFSLDLSSFDTSSVKDMSYMFQYCGYSATMFSLNLTGFSNSNVTGMTYMFQYCGYSATTFSLDLTSFGSSNVTNMGYMFENCGYSATDFSLDLSSFDTSNVIYMSSMFRQCGFKATDFSLDLSSFDTSSVTSMSQMFRSCGYYASDFNLDLSNFDTSSVTSMSYMFYYCGARSLNLSSFDTSSVTNMSYMFYGCGINATEFSLDLSNFDTSSVTTMSYMFHSCGKNATSFSLDLSSFDTSSVTEMSYMFNECGLNVSDLSLNLSSFNTSIVKYMSYMFYDCGATMLDLSSFDTSKVTSMTYMFRNCSKLQTIYVSEKWDVSAVTSSSSMFYNCSSLVGGNGTAYNSSYTDKTYARIDTTETPGYFTDIEDKYAITLKTGYEMNSLIKGVDYTESNGTITTIIFDYYRDELGNKTTQETYYDKNGQDLISGATGVDATSNGTGRAKVYFAGGTSVYILAMGKLYMNENAAGTFYRINGVTNEDFKIEFKNFNTSKVTIMTGMFDTCGSSATSLIIDLSSFDTSRVTDMSEMFHLYGYSVASFSLDLSSFNTSRVTDMSGMFSGVCHSSKSSVELDLSSFNTSNVTDMSEMFSLCGRDATDVSLDLSSFDTSNVTNMSEMFSTCGLNAVSVSLNLSSFDTSSVTDMGLMFWNCGNNATGFSLDLSSFDTSSVTIMGFMFSDCGATTIYVSNKWTTANVESSTGMFSRCYKLVGGNGTAYNSGCPVDKTYACVDASGTPGFFTYKASSDGAETDNPVENSVANWKSLVIVFGLIAVLFSFFTFCVFYVKRIKHGDKNFKI